MQSLPLLKMQTKLTGKEQSLTSLMHVTVPIVDGQTPRLVEIEQSLLKFPVVGRPGHDNCILTEHVSDQKSRTAKFTHIENAATMYY
jgi:hypothetical protein